MTLYGGLSQGLIILLVANLDQRRRAEEQLRESESRFRIVADSATVLIWMSGVDKLCTFFNKAWLDFTGRTVEQEIGNGWTAAVCIPTISRAASRPTAIRLMPGSRL